MRGYLPFVLAGCLLTFQAAASAAAGAAAGASASAASAEALDAGRVLFNSGATPACAICHTLKDADAEGTIGPSLDALKPDAARVRTVLKSGLGVMPSYEALTDEQAQALSNYVAAVAGK